MKKMCIGCREEGGGKQGLKVGSQGCVALVGKSIQKSFQILFKKGSIHKVDNLYTSIARLTCKYM